MSLFFFFLDWFEFGICFVFFDTCYKTGISPFLFKKKTTASLCSLWLVYTVPHCISVYRLYGGLCLGKLEEQVHQMDGWLLESSEAGYGTSPVRGGLGAGTVVDKG